MVKYIYLVVSISLLFMSAHMVFAAEEKAGVSTPPATLSKSLAGYIETIRAGYITIIYKEDKGSDNKVVTDHEAVFPIDNNTKVANKKSMSELIPGDKVEIRYNETSWIDENGVGRVERKAIEVRFIKRAEKGLSSYEE